MSLCSRCGASLGCAMNGEQAKDAPCWCTAYPSLSDKVLQQMAEQGRDAACLCPACLVELIESHKE